MRMKLLVFVVVTLYWLILHTPLITEAQDSTVEPIQLVDVPVTEELIISVPDDWLIWRRSDFDTLEEADLAVNALFGSVDPSSTFTISTNDVALFYALKPTLVNGLIIFVRIDVVGLDQFATIFQVSPEDVKPEEVMTILKEEVWDSYEVNGRSTAVGAVVLQGALDLLVTTVFPEQNLVSQIQFLVDSPWLTENLYFITLIDHSLRVEGEDIDLAIIEHLMEDQPLPDHILLPVTDEPAAVLEPEATVDAEAKTKTAISCTVSASNNVNLRAGPGTGFDLRGSMGAGTSLQATGQIVGSDGKIWYQLENDSWVRADVVNGAPECAALSSVNVESTSELGSQPTPIAQAALVYPTPLPPGSRKVEIWEITTGALSGTPQQDIGNICAEAADFEIAENETAIIRIRFVGSEGFVDFVDLPLQSVIDRVSGQKYYLKSLANNLGLKFPEIYFGTSTDLASSIIVYDVSPTQISGRYNALGGDCGVDFQMHWLRDE